MTQEEAKDGKKGLTRSNDNKNDKRKFKKKDNVSELMTRVIIRQLPPTMTESQFLSDVAPLPDYNDFYYVNGDLSLGEFAFSRAYFKFKNFEELLIFKDKFDNYVFMDSKGNEYPAIVEYAPLQKMPRRCGDIKQTKVDTKVNTIESDPDYIAFMEELNSNSPSPHPFSADAMLEEIEILNRDVKENGSKMTPLLEFLSKRREEKAKIKEEKKRKKDDAKKKKLEEKKVVAKTTQEKENTPKEQAHQIKRRQAKFEDKKEEKKPKQDATYVIKVNADENKNKTVQANSNEQNVIVKETKPSTDERIDKDRAAQRATRIRNKDRPAREIYRPGTKPKAPPASGFGSHTSGPQPTPSTSNAATSSSSKPPPSKFKNRVFTRTTKE